MSDLVTWLRQQLDEDERAAYQELESGTIPTVGWSPPTVIDFTEAIRAIIDGHDDSWPRARLYCPTCCGYDGRDNYGREVRPPEAYPCRVVRLLAVPYVHRPGYDEAWRLE